MLLESFTAVVLGAYQNHCLAVDSLVWVLMVYARAYISTV